MGLPGVALGSLGVALGSMLSHLNWLGVLGRAGYCERHKQAYKMSLDDVKTPDAYGHFQSCMTNDGMPRFVWEWMGEQYAHLPIVVPSMLDGGRFDALVRFDASRVHIVEEFRPSEWRPINDFPTDRYLINQFGKVIARDGYTLRRTFKDMCGRHAVSLSDGTKVKSYMVHRLVAQTFCTRCDGDKFVRFRDGNVHHIHPANLVWVKKTNARLGYRV
jgi:hypothetical protein